MNEKGLIEQSNAAIKAALELYAADHGKLNDGDSFTTKLNNCVLTISLKDGSLDVQFDPDADVAVDTPYTLDMKLDIYEEEDKGEQMDKQKIKSVPRLTTDNPVNNFQTALNFTDVSEDGWVWLRQPEMALTEYARQLVKGHGSSIDLGCNDMELSESLTDHLFDDPKQSIDGLIAEHYTILWAYATLREKLKWYEDAGIPVIPNYGLSTIRRAINRYGTALQLQMAIKEMSELTKAICNLQRAVTFNYRNGAKIKVAHESVREEIADVYIMLAQLVEIVGKPEEVQQIVLEKLEQLKGCLDDGEVRSE